MTDEYIRKQDAMEAVEFGITLASAINIETGERTELFQRENDELREAVKRVKDIEPADVAPVRHGNWTLVGWHKGMKVVECSCCKKRAIGATDFCPNCGARMYKE